MQDAMPVVLCSDGRITAEDGSEFSSWREAFVYLKSRKLRARLVLGRFVKVKELIIPDIRHNDLTAIVAWKANKFFPEFCRKYRYTYVRETGKYANHLDLAGVSCRYVGLLEKTCNKQGIMLEGIYVQHNGSQHKLPAGQTATTFRRRLPIGLAIILVVLLAFVMMRVMAPAVPAAEASTEQRPEVVSSVVAGNNFSDGFLAITDFISRQLPAEMTLLSVELDNHQGRIFFRAWARHRVPVCGQAEIDRVISRGDGFVISGRYSFSEPRIVSGIGADCCLKSDELKQIMAMLDVHKYEVGQSGKTLTMLIEAPLNNMPALMKSFDELLGNVVPRSIKIEPGQGKYARLKVLLNYI